jgi:hypothetical protein
MATEDQEQAVPAEANGTVSVAPDLRAAPQDDTLPPVETVPTMKDLLGVRYTGTANTRNLSQIDLERVGVESKGDLVWSADNDWFVIADELNAATRDFLATQPDFRVE